MWKRIEKKKIKQKDVKNYNSMTATGKKHPKYTEI